MRDAAVGPQSISRSDPPGCRYGVTLLSPVVLSGDVLHHPLQLVRPEWSSRACEETAMLATTRRALIERYADTDTLMASAHSASPSIGRIVSHRGAFAYRLTGEA